MNMLTPTRTELWDAIRDALSLHLPDLTVAEEERLANAAMDAIIAEPLLERPV